MRAPRPGDLALTVHQPWADLIVSGVKDVENRTWPVPSATLHGRVWIHAGQSFDDSWKWSAAGPRVVRHEQYGTAPWVTADRCGVLLGSVQVDGCHHADWCDKVDGDLVTAWPDTTSRGPRYCSRWAEPDVYHWRLSDPQPLADPIPMRGRQRLWRITADDR